MNKYRWFGHWHLNTTDCLLHCATKLTRHLLSTLIVVYCNHMLHDLMLDLKLFDDHVYFNIYTIKMEFIKVMIV